MSNELQAYTTTGLTLYAVLLDGTGQAWNGSAFEALAGANWATYDIALTEAAAGIYLGDMPAAAAGLYSYVVYEQVGGSPATTDTIRGSGVLVWDGSSEPYPPAVNVTYLNGSATPLDNLVLALGNADGTVKADVQQLLHTALTEGAAGRLAAAFKKLLDVATPVLTTESVNQTGDSYATVTHTTYGLAALDAILAKLDTTWELDGTVYRFTTNALEQAAAGLTASETGDAVLDEVVEGGYTLRQLLRIFLAVLAGKSSGGASSTITFRDVADAKARVTATVGSTGNRTAVTLDGS